MEETALRDLTENPETGSSRAAFTGSVQVCSKCCRKLGNEGKSLRKAIKAAIRDAYGDKVDVEKTDCFSLCPKGGQVVAAYSKRQPRRLVILEPESNVERAVEYLLRQSE